jgi:hypothetical protein
MNAILPALCEKHRRQGLLGSSEAMGIERKQIDMIAPASQLLGNLDIDRPDLIQIGMQLALCFDNLTEIEHPTRGQMMT